MKKTISHSTTIMFLFDLLILSGISNCVWSYTISQNINTSRIIAIVLIVITGLFSLFLKGQYKIREHNITSWNIYRLFEGVVMAHIPTAILLLFYIDKFSLLKFSGVNILVIYILLGIYRLFFHYYLFEFKKTKKVLIVGVNERAKVIAEEIINKSALKMEVAGLVRTDEIDKKIRELEKAIFHLSEKERKLLDEENNFDEIIIDDKVPVFENGKDIHDITLNTNADIVVFTYASPLMSAIPWNIKEYSMPEFYEMVTGKFYVDSKTALDFRCDFSRKNNIWTTLTYDIPKRIFDIISASIILLVTLPITAYIAIRVKLTDGASPFFSQTRVGRDGKTFGCYKLRTMYVNDYKPKDGDDVKYAESVKADDRIIPFCKFVRKARFDEIPQMVNILKGEMSIVGPRAEWADEVKVFKNAIPFYGLRNLVRAGWTGWSHINMNPVFSVDEEKERLAYDLYYIKHRNVFWEIAILIKAVFLAVGGRHK